jgi:hypothetical protein
MPSPEPEATIGEAQTPHKRLIFLGSWLPVQCKILVNFPDLDDLETGIFYMTLLCTAVATALLIAPSAHHRMLWRGGRREQRLVLGNRLTIAGLNFLFGLTAAVIVTALLALFFALLWFAFPLRYHEGED